MPVDYTKGTVPSDVFLSFGLGPIYHFETKVVTNGTANDWDLAPGYPMDDNVPVLGAGIADIDGLLYDRARIPAGESKKCLVLARGPAVINRDRLPTADYAGTPFVNANLVTQIADIPGIIVTRSEPDTETTLTVNDD